MKLNHSKVNSDDRKAVQAPSKFPKQGANSCSGNNNVEYKQKQDGCNFNELLVFSSDEFFSVMMRLQCWIIIFSPLTV